MILPELPEARIVRGTGNQFRNETESELHAREIAELKSVLKAANQGLIFKCQTCGQTEKYDHRGCETKVASISTALRSLK